MGRNRKLVYSRFLPPCLAKNPLVSPHFCLLNTGSNCIVIKDLSRIGRNYIETGEYLEKIFPLLGVRLIAVNDRYDNLKITNGEQLVSNLKNLVNDIYSKDISRKVAASAHSRQEQGLFIGAYPMYGYLKDPSDKHKIIVDPETAPIVRQIFQWKSDGMGTAAICRRLGDAGIPSPNSYRFMKGIVKHSKYENAKWAIPTIQQILITPKSYRPRKPTLDRPTTNHQS